MTANLRIQNLTVDAHDPGSIATFSQEALGWRRSGEERGLVVLEPPAASPEEPVSPDLLFSRVPEEKSVKNRLHLDLRPRDQLAEVERLESLGARRVFIGQGDDVTFLVLADPKRNEFCVLSSLED